MHRLHAGERAKGAPRTGPSSVRRVYLSLDERYWFARQVHAGVRRYAWEHAWHCRVWPIVEAGWEFVRAWEPDGIIAQCATEALERCLVGWGGPVVNVSGACPGAPLPSVQPDGEAIGRIAGEHLLSRGLRHIAYLGWVPLHASRTHEAALAATVRMAGAMLHTFDMSRIVGRAASKDRDAHELLAHWVRMLPKPVGMLVFSDTDVEAVLDACMATRTLVPDELALLGVGSDPLFCDACIPSLSSIALAGEGVGHEAAKMLDTLMRGDAPPSHSVLIPPGAMTTRQSTRTLVELDPAVRAAVQYIEDHAHQSMRVSEVVRATSASQRILQLRFRRERGRTIQAEIRLAHFARAKALLADTDLPIGEVARRSGFHHPPHLCLVFRQMLATTPSAYRAQHRPER
jgi:LacI family transcriptional regulator